MRGKGGYCMNSTYKSYLGMTLTCFIWCSAFYRIQRVFQVMGPFTLVFFRFSIAFLLLWVYGKIIKNNETILKEDKMRLYINGIIGSVVYYSISNYTVKYLPAVDSATLSSMQLIIMLWVEGMLLKKLANQRKVIYVVLVTIGGILLMEVLEFNFSIMFSYGFMFIATCFWVLYYVIQKPLLKKYKPTTIIKYQCLPAMIITFPALFIENNQFAHMGTSYIVDLIFLGALGICVGYSLNSYALKHIGATNTSMLLMFQPVIILITNIISGVQKLTLADYIGIVFIGVGVFLMIYDVREYNKSTHKEVSYEYQE